MTTTTNQTQASKYIIKTSSAKMPGNCWGRYAHVAVIETDGRDTVSMISSRARGVKRIVRAWYRCHVGFTSRCEYRRVLAQAEALVASLSSAQVVA
jgi:hypothetical protein